jgi:hypothetical protein
LLPCRRWWWQLQLQPVSPSSSSSSLVVAGVCRGRGMMRV